MAVPPKSGLAWLLPDSGRLLDPCLDSPLAVSESVSPQGLTAVVRGTDGPRTVEHRY